MRSRIFCKFFLALLLAGCATGPDGPSKPVTGHRYVPEADFQRIAGYFTGREHPGDRLYLRSRPESRAGYYWMLPLDGIEEPRRIDGILLRVQAPGSPETRTYPFSPDDPMAPDKIVWVGLTGSDWPDPEARPIAWRIELRSADGELLAARESFLWSAPLPDDDHG
jgi:hypothetical protein